MGRLFVTELEEGRPVYKCKHCKIDFAVSDDDRINKSDHATEITAYGKLYFFPKCFNVVFGTEKVSYYYEVVEVYCISCSSLVGLSYEKFKTKYNKGYFLLNRFKLEGPPDGSDDDDENAGNIEE